MGQAGVEALLKTTIEMAVAITAVKKADLHRVIVDTTVSEKAIAQGWSPARQTCWQESQNSTTGVAAGARRKSMYREPARRQRLFGAHS